jgi:hypothetical protein
VQLQVENDHQYWIEGDSHGLVVMDPEAHPIEFDFVQTDFQWIDIAGQNFCPKVAQPAAQPGSTPHTKP